MNEETGTTSPAADPSAALRMQILATEHWSLLATRSVIFSEVFSRTTIFLTVVSATVVSLALVAQATDFGDGFYAFALLVLPVVLILGVGTYVSVGDANNRDAWLLLGMNRLRHGYLELLPDLEPYFITGHHDDEEGLFEAYGPGARLRPSRILASTPMLVGAIDAMVAGVLAGLFARVLDASAAASVGIGVAVAAGAIGLLAVSAARMVRQMRSLWTPLFPRPDA